MWRGGEMGLEEGPKQPAVNCTYGDGIGKVRGAPQAVDQPKGPAAGANVLCFLAAEGA